jgi:hypothetical protein
MSNRKIDQLPRFSGDTTGVHVVINNASNTTTHTVTKEIFLDGNNTFHGNQVISGSLSISGLTEFGGNLVPRTAKGATLGTLERPFREIYIQSASINIASDIPGGRNAAISNADGNVTIQAAGLQLKSGSFVSFEVSETARTIIRVPNIPAGDIGALSIIGNTSGSYQPVTNAGGMIHITSNDGVSSRITSDAFGTTAFAAYVGRKARGTAANPLPVQSGDTLTRISAIGWTGPDYGFTMSSSLTTAPTSLDVIALENFTTSSFGTVFKFFNSPLGNTTRVLSATIDTTGINIPNGSDFKKGGTSYTASLATTGSNTFVGNQTITGSLNIQSGSQFPQDTGSSLVTYNQTTGQFAHTSYKSALTPLLQGAGFYSTVTQSGSANVSSSFKFNNNITTDEIQIVSESRIVCPTPATYNIQFSIQVVQGSGESDVVVWLKKNGSNVTNSASHIYVPSNNKVLVALNLWDQTTNPNDYYELAYQSSDNDTTYQYIAPSGNLPGSPSVILTINQVK